MDSIRNKLKNWKENNPRKKKENIYTEIDDMLSSTLDKENDDK